MFQLDLLESSSEEEDRILEKDNESVLETSTHEIAIIGMSAKLPKSKTHKEFWELLSGGVDGVAAFPEARQRELEPYLGSLRRSYANLSLFDGAYLEDISSFDYSFFRLSPKEASLMSPNQRLFLQTAWNALEDGGYGGEGMRGTRTGVFIGHNADALHDYKRIIETLDPEALSMAAPGNLSSMIASRISYLMNLKGPAVSVDTACSSSLVAVHLACQSIRTGECDLAIAGSVKLNLLPLDIGIRLGIESSDNRAKPFDDSSDGTGIGDGVVALLLKPLAKAQSDGDHIYAVIKGSAINQDGSSVGITAPNALAQEDAIVRAWQDANVDPETITYMEAHGTGTSLGDPIEIDGMTRAFARFTDKKQFCAIGSVKSNIGHLDHAAGIVGLLKGVLSLTHQMLPPTLHYKLPNRKISFVDSPVYVNDTLMPWVSESSPRRCGVSAFGMSGTNCHVVLEEAPERTRESALSLDEGPRLFVLSAQSKAALQNYVADYLEWLSGEESQRVSLADLCYSASIGRSHYRHRLAVVAEDAADLRDVLQSLHDDGLFSGMSHRAFVGEGGLANDLSFALAGDAEIGAAFGREQLVRLARRYVKEEEVDFVALYQGERRKRLPLPVYPFERHACWVEPSRAFKRLESLAQSGANASGGGTFESAGTALAQGTLSSRENEQAELHGTVLLGECSGSETARTIADVWGELLGYRELHSEANFYELGGDSIIALRIVNRLSEQFEAKLEVIDLLARPVLKQFAGAIEERLGHQADPEEASEAAIRIPVLPKSDHYAVSSPQQRMYLQQQAAPDDRSYNLPEMLHIEGGIDASLLEAAIRQLVARHETLRTSFAVIEGELRGIVHEHVSFELHTGEVDELALPERLNELSLPFDLSRAPLLRASLLTLRPDHHLLVLDMHHIASDGMSAGILLKELISLYRGEELQPLKLQYHDYSAWQAEQLQSERMEGSREFWREQFRGEWPVLELPTDYPRPPVKSSRGDTFDLYLDEERAAKVRKLAAETETTPYMVLLSAYYTLLAKYTGADDFAVGTPITGRVSRELESVVGMFVGTLVLRGYPTAHKSFSSFLQEIKEMSVKAFQHSEFPFEELAQWGDRRDSSRNPLFDTMFIMQNLNIPDFSTPEFSYRHERFPHGTAKYDLMIQAVEQPNGSLRFVVEYCTDLFREETVRTMMRHYMTLLDSVAANPGTALGDCEMLSDEDKEMLLNRFGSKSASFPAPVTLQQCFEDQADRVPNHAAVQFEADSLSYRELNERANRLARKLQEKGIGRHSIVGVMAERSLAMMTAMLGIMKAGGAYMPIDPHYPGERIRYMLSDSGAELLLTDGSAPDETEKVLELPSMRLSLALTDEGDGRPLAVERSADDRMYVIYTSGSTGEPKGVMVPHRSFFNFGHSLRTFYDGKFDERDRCLSLTNISFDVSVYELFMPLMFGACVVLYPEPKHLDPRQMASVIVEEGITSAYLPPTLLGDVARTLSKDKSRVRLSKMLVGVEPIKDETLELYAELNPAIRIVNGYGPTEATICSNMFLYKPGSVSGAVVPIGGPMHGVDIHILGYGDKLAPAGVPGELCISGNGLALGYVNKPEMTASRFVEHPLKSGVTMYRTGDLAKWRSDGSAMYVGRIDHQVKIRGVRIELGEIQAQLVRHEQIEAAVVLVQEDKAGDKRICAYIVLNQQSGEMNIHELKSFLRRSLPDAMIPSYFLSIEAIPLTPNGKVDRKALPEPQWIGSDEEGDRPYISPSGKTQQKLAAIWEELLHLERVGADGHFFDLGGHSLKAATLVSRIQEEFGAVVPLRVVFEQPTLAELASVIDSASGEGYKPIPKQPDQSDYPMSRTQRRQYVLQLLSSGGTMYNLPFALELRGKLDLHRLEAAFARLVERHESLRTTFHYNDGDFKQQVHGPDEVSFKLERLSGFDTAVKGVDYTAHSSGLSGSALQERIEGFVKSFSLDKGPLLRAGIAQLEEDYHLLLLDMHHIVTDGVSMGIFVGELTALYGGAELPALAIQYRDYAAWQEERLTNETAASREHYWLDLFQDELPVLELPTDWPRPAVQSYAGRRIAFAMDARLTDAARKFAKERGVTLFSVLLGAYSALLARYSGQEDIIVGTPVAGRTHGDTAGLIGMFVNTVAVRSRPQRSMKIGDYFEELHNGVLGALEHQEYPFEDLVERIGVKRDQSRNPIFDTMFILQNMDRAPLEAGDLSFMPLDFEPGVSKFDLTLEAAEEGEEIAFHLEYATALFLPETVERLAQHYLKLVEEMTASGGRDRIIGELELLSSEEMAILQEDADQEAFLESAGALEVIAEQEMHDTSNWLVNDKAERAEEDGAETGWIGFMEQFERQVAKTPDAAALLFGSEVWSYRQLNERANRLAHTLKDAGVGPERIVALMTDRSPLLLIGILGIMKAGGAYVAIDPAYPPERVAWMLEDCGEQLLLTEKAYANRAASASQAWYLDDPGMYGDNADNPPIVIKPEGLAYVLYTSGSTGRPKGAMIEHRGLASFLKGFGERIPMREGQAILAMATASFDIFIVENLLPLMLGMRIVLASEEERNDAGLLQELMAKHEVDVLQITPSRFKWWLAQTGQTESFRPLSIFMIGAEPLSKELFAGIRELTDARVFNLYGPTETTVWTSICEVTDGNAITIGTPIAGATMVIMNEAMQVQPIGVIGEICIGGRGVGRGYLSHPERGTGVFVDDPLCTGGRMYKTGDLGRRLASGEFQYAGRRDHQVKIRGHRIETGEIESQLLALEEVRETLVTAIVEGEGEQTLCAYIVGQEKGGIPQGELRRKLASRLPDYMIPTYFVELDAIPLTPTGKVDRKALPAPNRDQRETRLYVAPATETERKLASVWSELLNVAEVGAEDRFFELGGHSLKAAMLAGRIGEQFGVHVQLKDIFLYSDLRSLAAHIDGHDGACYEPIPRLDTESFYPMSRAQKRQYVLQLISGDSTAYHVPFALELLGKLDSEGLEASFHKLIARHESLRTTFHYEKGQFVQRIHDEMAFKLESNAWARMVAKRLASAEDFQKLVDELMRRFIRPFSLGEGPLLRAWLVPTGEDRHLLLLDMHHIVTDGVSVSLLLKEVTELYSGQNLPELRIQYRDYAAWMENRLNGDAYLAHESYWLEQFSSTIPVLELPTDYPRPASRSTAGESHSFRLEAEAADGVRRLAREQDTTLYTVLLGAYAVFLGGLSGQEDVVVGSPVAGRSHADTEGLIGMFVNTVAIRSMPERKLAAGQYFKRLHGQVIESLEHQEYPFEDLVERTDAGKDQSRHPLFDTMFILQNMERSDMHAGELVFRPQPFDPGVSKFDLTLEAVETASGEISFNLEYSTALFRNETAKELANGYLRLLAKLAGPGSGQTTIGRLQTED
ncbi:amino acid adenylation domain-containing protein [Paenibacillus sp. GCM10027627]|uniref:amino acid adenylation domain-containing protein n=1 Tax=unclassified Paenibacillus TaxID=185978 RepID=UPI0036365F12